ncbi:dehydrogenase [Siccirubricoccus deserti]|uniref:C-terminal binding protein n=1 Tax=Siccirubricoccus deserti TaxID=2013562 RepID=A0A9X0UCV7_9PROT|nr:C-terminal binding protein [Siccirubricoccus deserti]MBC4015714.1 C-terminal binding protein [Siccirubricoccus deserti]GGC44033.1 dehydrogenase [Siccirubricoccus deserti]
MLTVLEPEGLYSDTAIEQAILGPGVRILQGNAKSSLAELPDEMLAEVDGLMTLRMAVPAEQLARFPKLKAVVRMGVGYDRVDRAACAARGILVANLPDYGTQEVAEFAVLLAVALRRGLTLYHDSQRGPAPAPWAVMPSAIVRRQEVQTFGILGLGRIGSAAALRAKAFGYKVVFFDPYQPNGWDRALGISRARTLEALLEQSDVLSIHCPLTRTTRGLVDEAALRRLPKGAVVVNTARGPILDIEALERCLRDGHLAGAGLDVIPVEPPVEPIPSLLRAYRAQEEWTRGRLIITPHIAFHSPEAWQDIRVKGVETMRDVLVEGKRTNVIPPESD